MKVYHICSYFYNSIFHNLMKSQLDAGIEARLFYYSTRKSQKLPKYDLSYLDVYNSDMRLRTPLTSTLRINNAAENFLQLYGRLISNYDIIHAHTLFADGYIAYMANMRYGIPYIAAVNNSDMNGWFYWKLPWEAKRLPSIISNANKIEFVSCAYKEKLSAKLPEPYKSSLNNKSMIMPFGIDDFWFCNRIAGNKSFNANRLRLIQAGDISVNKNQITAAKAILELKKKGLDIEYTVVGKKMDDRTANTLKKMGVKILPYCGKEELLHLYRENDIFIMASVHETFGLVYGEALTQGLPLIYTRGEGFDKQFDDGEVGYSVDCTSTREIQKRIIQIRDNYEAISRRAVEKSEKFNWAGITEAYKKMYNEIITANLRY